MKEKEKKTVGSKLRKFKYKKVTLPVLVAVFLAFMMLTAVLSYKTAIYQETQKTQFWKSIATEAEPKICSLCEYGEAMSYHAPALVNLSTGEVGEMRVYKSEMVGDTLEIAPIQQTGAFAFVRCAGLTGYQDTCSHTFRIEIPKEIKPMNVGRFCRNCRMLLAETANSSFAIVDLFDLDNIKAYNIENGAEYIIRDYMISVSRETYIDQLNVAVHGNANNLTFID